MVKAAAARGWLDEPAGRDREPDGDQARGSGRDRLLLGEGAGGLAVGTESLSGEPGRLIPGGVNSPVRAWNAVSAGEPFFARRGEGAYLEDTEGRRYVDWVHVLGAARLRPRRPRDRGGRAGGGRRRDDLRHADRARGRARRGDRGRGAVGGEGAAGLVGHGGGHERDPAGARRDPPRPHPQVRGLLPRPRRRAARRGRLRPRHARAAVQPGRASRRGRRHDRHRLQRRRRRCGRSRALRRGARGGHRRAGRREHGRRPARAGVPRSAAGRSATHPAPCSSSTR